jgi:hypothetical protein
MTWWLWLVVVVVVLLLGAALIAWGWLSRPVDLAGMRFRDLFR